MRTRRLHTAVIVGTVMAIVAFVAAVTGPSIYLDRNPRALLEVKSGMQLPSEAEVGILRQSDGGFQNDFVTIYLIRFTDRTDGTVLDPGRLVEPVEGELRDHLRDLTVIVTQRPTLHAHAPTACEAVIPSIDDEPRETLLCRTTNDSECLVYETNN